MLSNMLTYMLAISVTNKYIECTLVHLTVHPSI